MNLYQIILKSGSFALHKNSTLHIGVRTNTTNNMLEVKLLISGANTMQFFKTHRI